MADRPLDDHPVPTERIRIAFYLRGDLADRLQVIATKQKTVVDVLVNEIVAEWLGEK